jgi:hypothetical protein
MTVVMFVESGTSFGIVMKAADYSILNGVFDAPVVVAANLTCSDTVIVRGNTSFYFFFVSGDDIMIATSTGCRNVRYIK